MVEIREKSSLDMALTYDFFPEKHEIETTKKIRRRPVVSARFKTRLADENSLPVLIGLI